ncbi:hypothetical protein JMJ35_010449 [Cladonia borealis]|uniref:Uncharacterized protein n=1 Tax=Cladonia borealis TaxID=184061 RepID=A0AA39QT49_9LECA|nr:hypothetical protein JMJ35_010449 [Cladonia borealis]
MHSDASLQKITSDKTVFGFLLRKRRGKSHISSEVSEYERLRSLPPLHTSPVPIYCNTPVKIRDYYLSKSTVQLLPRPPPFKIMDKSQARTPNLTINTDTANDTEPPVSLHKSRSMGTIRDNARPFELSSTRNELVKREHVLTEANKSPDSSTESSSDDGLDDEELLQAEFDKHVQIGREKGYNDDDVHQWVDYVLEHGLPEPKTGSKVDSPIIETGVDYNKARVPEFTQRDPAVKEIERHHLQDIFGEDIISTRQLLVDNQNTSTEFTASSGSHPIYLQDNADIASHTTIKACGHDTISSPPSSATSHNTHLPAPNIEQIDVADTESALTDLLKSLEKPQDQRVGRPSCGTDHRSATPDAEPVWFRADMDCDEFPDSSDIGFNAKNTAVQQQELKAMGTSASELTQRKGAFNPSKMTESSLVQGTYRTPDGLIPLLLPRRYNKEKLNDGGQSSATGISTPLNQKWKEQLSEATATLANLADSRTSIDSYENQSYNSSFEDKQSQAADQSGDSPTLGHAHLSPPSASLQNIYTPNSSRFHPRSLPSSSPFANNKMKMPPKTVGPGKFKSSPRDVSLPSPCDTFSESSVNTRRRASTIITKETKEYDEKMRYANERLQALRCETGTEIIWRDETDPGLTWRNHPNHDREWHSANLRCMGCLGFCNVCRAPCCIYFEAIHIMREVNYLPEEKRETAKLLKRIDQWCPLGVDTPTSLQCTECYRRICPNCCGVCPIFPCHDRICKVFLIGSARDAY